MEGKILHQETFKGTSFTFYDNGLCYVVYPDFIQMELDIAMHGDNCIKKLNLNKYSFVGEFQAFSDVSKEARAYLAGPEPVKWACCHAVFLKNKSLRFLANAYLKFNRPNIPTKFFNSKEKAIDWALSFQNNSIAKVK